MNQIFELPIKIEAIPFRKNNNKIEYLLIRRVPDDGGFWQPVTGTVESNESLEECVYRELLEEVGVSSKDVEKITDMFYHFTWQKGDMVIYEYVYGVELCEEVKITLSSEHDAYQWCDADMALQTLEKENNKKALLEFEKIVHSL